MQSRLKTTFDLSAKARVLEAIDDELNKLRTEWTNLSAKITGGATAAARLGIDIDAGSGFAVPSSRVAHSSRSSRIGRWPRLSSTRCFPLVAPTTQRSIGGVR